VQDRDIDTKEG